MGVVLEAASVVVVDVRLNPVMVILTEFDVLSAYAVDPPYVAVIE